MDTGLTTRPIAGQNTADIVRATPVPVENAVATELAPARSVTAVPSAADARQNATAFGQNDLSHEVLIDPAAREVIFRVVDVSTGRVVRQVPDEALLRLRAYTRAVASGSPLTNPQTSRRV